jgi:putative effector of murein hydrolase LrgA (UPF0299 family)
VSLIVMILSILVSGGALFAGYAAGGMDAAARWFLIPAGVWLLGYWQRWHWIGSVMLLVFVAGAAAGLWLGLPPGLMLVGAVAALLGWDLAGFQRRLHFAAITDDVPAMERRHLIRVGIVALIAALAAGISLLVHIRVPFEVAVLLVLVAALGLSRLAAWLQHENEL